jgi:hypothetical protein
MIQWAFETQKSMAATFTRPSAASWHERFVTPYSLHYFHTHISTLTAKF